MIENSEKKKPLRSVNKVEYNLFVELVFFLKKIDSAFSSDLITDITSVIDRLCASQSAELVNLDYGDGYVVVIVCYPPQMSVSTIVNNIKKVTSRHIKNTYPELAEYFIDGHFWSRSYYAGSVSGPSSETAKYIKKHVNRKYCYDN